MSYSKKADNIKQNEEPSEYKINKAEPEDWKKIGEGIMNVEAKSFEESERFEEEYLRVAFKKESWYEFKDVFNYFASDKNGNVAGYLISCRSDALKYKDGNAIIIESIAVLPEHRNKGIGGKFLSAVSDAAGKAGYKRIALHTNEPAMKRLAETSGFKFKFLSERKKKQLYQIEGKNYMEKKFE